MKFHFHLGGCAVMVLMAGSIFICFIMYALFLN